MAHAAAPLADWTFAEAAGTTLNATANTGTGLGGPGSTWDVAVPGVSTSGSGQLWLRNTGSGGSGTRTTYADFGPVNGGTFSAGTLSLYLTLAAWQLTGASTTLGLALIEGSNFNVASLELVAGAGSVTVGTGTDEWGDGSAMPSALQLPAAGSAPLTLALSVGLDSLGWSLAVDTGGGFLPLGSGAVDSLTLGVNSLRLAITGDWTTGSQPDSGLLLDRIWVAEGAVTLVPEPGTWALWLAGLAGMGASCWRRRSGR